MKQTRFLAVVCGMAVALGGVTRAFGEVTRIEVKTRAAVGTTSTSCGRLMRHGRTASPSWTS